MVARARGAVLRPRPRGRRRRCARRSRLARGRRRGMVVVVVVRGLECRSRRRSGDGARVLVEAGASVGVAPVGARALSVACRSVAVWSATDADAAEVAEDEGVRRRARRRCDGRRRCDAAVAGCVARRARTARVVVCDADRRAVCRGVAADAAAAHVARPGLRRRSPRRLRQEPSRGALAHDARWRPARRPREACGRHRRSGARFCEQERVRAQLRVDRAR